MKRRFVYDRAGQLQPSGGINNSLMTRLRAPLVCVCVYVCVCVCVYIYIYMYIYIYIKKEGAGGIELTRMLLVTNSKLL